MDSLDRRQGLSSEQVVQRVRDGLSNADEGIKTKTEKQIILENTFTFFNILNFVLALFVLLVGSFKNLLFLGVIFSNIIIGSFQGIRAKRTMTSSPSFPHRRLLCCATENCRRYP